MLDNGFLDMRRKGFFSHTLETEVVPIRTERSISFFMRTPYKKVILFCYSGMKIAMSLSEKFHKLFILSLDSIN